MQNTKIILVAACLALATFLGLLIGEKKSADATSVVRTYNVPPGRAAEIRSALNNLFWEKKDEARSGSAQVFGNGLMMVKAPAAFQEGISHFVDELAQQKETSRQTIRVKYWMVAGEESKASGREALGALAPALAAIEKVDGHRKFKVLENFSTVVIDGNKSRVESGRTELNVSANVTQGKAAVDLEVHSNLGKLATFTQLPPGEFAVIGQNSLVSKEKDADTGRTNIYHILQVELLP